MTTVCCVLKSGGEYKPEHVHALRDMIRIHLPLRPFICFTDIPDEVDCQTHLLEHDWPGWWSKIEVFGYHGPVIYLDLDTIIIDDLRWLAEIAHRQPFVMLRDFYRGKTDPFARGSGIMTWAGDMSWILRLFDEGPDAYIAKFKGRGDQGFLESVARAEPLQDLAPHKLISFKVDKKPTVKTSVVVFHGRPRPWQQQDIPYMADSEKTC
jgi:hypothetical protein